MPKVHAFDVLAQPPSEWPPIVAVYGSDGMLHSWVLRLICPSDGDTDRIDMDGTAVEWRDLRDELQSGSLFAQESPRWIVLHDADDFLEANREALEKYVSQPNPQNRFLLRLQSLPGNTRLYKAISANHLAIQCAVPLTEERNPKTDNGRIRQFLMTYVAPQHQCQIQKGAADTLIELVGPNFGFLSNSIARLALHLPVGGTIPESLVRQVIEGWQTKSTWDIIESAANGRTADSLRQLCKLFDLGQVPLALLPQFAWSLRRLAMTNAIMDYGERTGKRPPLENALELAGFRPGWQTTQGATQLKAIGRQRANHLMQWLLECDLKLKGSHSQEMRARWVLEELFLKLATSA